MALNLIFFYLNPWQKPWIIAITKHLTEDRAIYFGPQWKIISKTSSARVSKLYQTLKLKGKKKHSNLQYLP